MSRSCFTLALAGAVSIATLAAPRSLPAQTPCPGVAPPVDYEGAYYPCQVTIQARWDTGVTAPEYPAFMVRAGIEGIVLLQVVIDREGNVDSTSIRTFKSTHELFDSAARQAVVAWKATPAELGYRHVSQVVDHEFIFAAPASRFCHSEFVAPAEVTVICATSWPTAPTQRQPGSNFRLTPGRIVEDARGAGISFAPCKRVSSGLKRVRAGEGTAHNSRDMANADGADHAKLRG